MSKTKTEMNSNASLSSGQWVWNDEHQNLEFISFNPAADAKEKKKRTKAAGSDHAKRSERFGLSTAVSSRGQANARSPAERNTVGEAQRKACISCPKKGNKDCVAIEDIKQATILLLQEKSIDVPLSFLHVLKLRELDEFLASLLLYISCYFERQTLEKKTTPHMMEQSLTELKMLAEARAKVDLSLKQLAIRYSTLLLEVSLPLLSSRRGKASSTNKDRELFECLYSFLCYAAWVTFSRKDLHGIQEEVGRLLYSDTFNPARTIRERERKASEAQKGGEKEVKESPGPSKEQSEPARRLELSKVLTQRTPLMEALLPPLGQAATQLSGAARSQNDPMMQISPKETLLDELNAQLASLSFGILGKPLSQFSGATLLPQGAEGKEEEKEEEEKDSSNRGQSSKVSTADNRGSSSRANAVSRATTEGVTSDTE